MPTLLFIALIVGIVIRAQLFLQNPSLVHEESLLTMAISYYDWKAIFLFGKIEAPIGYAFLMKPVFLLLGLSEFVSRSSAFLGGIGSLLLFFATVKRLFSPIVAMLTLLLFSVNFESSRFALVAKPYSLDLFFSILLFYLFLTRRRKLVCLIGSVAIWCSHPVVFVLAGIGSAQILHYFFIRNTKSFRFWIVISTVWLSNFLLHYILSIRGLLQHTNFFPRADASGMLPQAIWAASLFRQPLILLSPDGFRNWENLWVSTLLVCLLPLGFYSLWKKNRVLFSAIIIMLLTVWVAEGFLLYPTGIRHSLYSLSAYLFVLGYAIKHVFETKPIFSVTFLKSIILPIILAVTFVLVVPFRKGWLATPIYYRGQPYGFRSVVSDIKDYMQPGDLVCVSYNNEHNYQYYSRQLKLATNYCRIGSWGHKNYESFKADIYKYFTKPRTWFILDDIRGVNQSKMVITAAGEIGIKLNEFRHKNTFAFLYQLKRPATKLDTREFGFRGARTF